MEIIHAQRFQGRLVAMGSLCGFDIFAECPCFWWVTREEGATIKFTRLEVLNLVTMLLWAVGHGVKNTKGDCRMNNDPAATGCEFGKLQ